ncbi:hypothetical protein F5050DRAFT_1852131 [Lentinula boryana]|uniref:Uncharacterized protein n=1 Tax=Lentinula boryana TaxID=40481 RepID=A0ABQ8Q2F1_9AGAR|nr:hypothetical protein F5050DRAFT_1852131 [Lentinula boryana]
MLKLGSASPSNSNKRGRISIASPSPSDSSKYPSPRAPFPSETISNTDHDLLNSILTRGSQGGLPASNDEAALAKMNVAESQIDSQCTQKSSQISSHLGPARPPTVRRSSTLSLPGVETLPEPKNDPNDDSTELWDEDVNELLSEEMVGCGLGPQSDGSSHFSKETLQMLHEGTLLVEKLPFPHT